MDGFNRLREIVNRLRDPEKGCPWDLDQTPKSLIPNFIEELYEVIEAIETEDSAHLQEELGDLLLHIMMQIRIAEEKGQFTLAEVLTAINDKLISRHPHVFDQSRQNDEENIAAETIKTNWERIKNNQKQRNSVLDGIPKSMPALIYAQRMQDKAAAVGFDWKDNSDVIIKIDEELNELKQAVQDKDITSIKEEIGDMFFSLVNLSRKFGFDSESVLKQAATKFYSRFNCIEKHHQVNNENIYDSSLEKLDELWQEAKKDF